MNFVIWIFFFVKIIQYRSGLLHFISYPFGLLILKGYIRKVSQAARKLNSRREILWLQNSKNVPIKTMRKLSKFKFAENKKAWTTFNWLRSHFIPRLTANQVQSIFLIFWIIPSSIKLNELTLVYFKIRNLTHLTGILSFLNKKKHDILHIDVILVVYLT